MREALRRPVVLVPVIVVAVAAIGLALSLFQPWRLFTDVTVDEALPTPVASSVPLASAEAAEPAAQSPAPVPSASAPSPAPEPSASAPSPEPTGPQVLAEGDFISHEHATTGTVRVLELADGSRVLRIERLDTSNGPDLKVWITDAPVIEGTDGWFVFDDGAYVDLGALKGNQGNQNYPIPDGVDLSALTSVSIWCDRFSVSFGAAELAPVT